MDNIKKILQQLTDLKQERIDKQQSIERLERYIQKLEEDGYSEIDSVTGGNGGTQHFKIEGYPYPLYTKKRTLLMQRKLNLELIQDKIDKQIAVAEQFINELEDSRMRRLLTYRYIDDLSWVQVAHRMGKHHTEESCRKTVERFFEKI